MAWGRLRTGAEDGEELVTSYGISIKELSQTKDHCSLERDTAKDTTIDQTLSSDGNAPNLAQPLTTVGHLLVGHAGHLQTQFLHQSEVNEGSCRCGKVG